MARHKLVLDHKIMHYSFGKSIRELVDQANELHIAREDVIGIIKLGEYYYLVYYYGEPDIEPTKA